MKFPSKICAATPLADAASAMSSSLPVQATTAPPPASPVTRGPRDAVVPIVPGTSGTVTSPPTLVPVDVKRCALADKESASCQATTNLPSESAAMAESNWDRFVVVLTWNSGGTACAPTCDAQSASAGIAAQIRKGGPVEFIVLAAWVQ